jgi:hypothetical protein
MSSFELPEQLDVLQEENTRQAVEFYRKTANLLARYSTNVLENIEGHQREIIERLQ